MDNLNSLHKRWNINFDQNSILTMFKNRILNYLVEISILSHQQIVDITDKFSNFAGIQTPHYNDYQLLTYEHNEAKHFQTFFSSVNDINQLGYFLQIFINVLYEVLVVLEIDSHQKQKNQEKYLLFINKLKGMFEMSPGIGMELNSSVNPAIILPSGVKFLDNDLINKNLDWLQEYPEISKVFETALQIYLSKDEKKYRNLLDNLRFSLEQLLKIILKNNKSLENQKDVLLNWLKGKNVNQQIINMFIQLLFGPYCIYQNDAVKHKSSYSEDDIEFMIYITATFMRLILKLEGHI